MRILILGGTGEARQLAEALVGAGHEVVTTLAGRTAQPHLPDGEVRIGGFGGADGMIRYLREARIERIIDATHPFATEISTHADLAAAATSVPLLRLNRPAWDGENWLEVPSVAAAAAALPAGAQVLVTSGHRGLETLLARADCRFVVRLIEPPAFDLPAHASLLLRRPPHTETEEIELMWGARITHLISKNSGGGEIPGKLLAAQALNVTIIMIGRPMLANAGHPSVGALLAALHGAAS